MTVIKIKKSAFEALLPLGAIGNADQAELVNGVFSLQNQIAAPAGTTIDLSTNAEDNGRASFKYESNKNGKKVKVGIRTLLFLNVVLDATKAAEATTENSTFLHEIIGKENQEDIELPSEFTVVKASPRKNEDGAVVYPAYMYDKFQEAVNNLDEDEGEDIGTLYTNRELMNSLPGTALTTSWVTRQTKMTAESPESFQNKYASKQIFVTLPQ